MILARNRTARAPYLSYQMVKDLKEAAEVSMGTEITIVDIVSIKALAEQVSGWRMGPA